MISPHKMRKSSVPRMWLRMLSRHLISSFMIIWPLVLILCPKMNASISCLSKTTVKYWVAHKWFSPIKWGNLFVGLSFPRMWFGMLSRHLISSFLIIWALILILFPKRIKNLCQYFLSFQNYSQVLCCSQVIFPHKMRKSLRRVFRSKDVIEDVVATSHIKFHDNLSIGSDFMPKKDKKTVPLFLIFPKVQSSIGLLTSDFPP